jgi:hypothetical protein
MRERDRKPTEGQIIFLKEHGLWHPGITAGEAHRLIREWADLHLVKYKD